MITRCRAFRVLGEASLRRSSVEHVHHFNGKWRVSAVTKLLQIALYPAVIIREWVLKKEECIQT